MGSPIKRFIDGVVYWREESIFRSWRNLRRAVRKHKRWYRRFLREQKKKKREEWLEWSQCLDEGTTTGSCKSPPRMSNYRKAPK